MSKLELGQKSSYDSSYNPDKLYPIPRALKRAEIGVDDNNLPFYGIDTWNHYEVSWLNAKGKPQVALANIVYDCSSKFIIESKSMKLYFNSLNNTKFEDKTELLNTIKKDISEKLGDNAEIKLFDLNNPELLNLELNFAGQNIDDLDIECNEYNINPDLLGLDQQHNDQVISEVLCSNLLKSNCLVTKQPDWASLQISYTGLKIDHEGLLKYIVSCRNHDEFHEQCIERIFVDIMRKCAPQELTVYGCYTRRGGVDINPYRTTNKEFKIENNFRLVRQ